MNNLKKRLHKIGNKKGFTLVELIVVIVIIGILAAVMIPKVGGFADKAKSAGALTEAKQVATAADATLVEQGSIANDATTQTKILNLAGVTGTGTNPLTLTATTNSADLVQFTYKTEVKKSNFTVTRDAEGNFSVEAK